MDTCNDIFAAIVFNIGAREAHNKLEAAMRYNQAGNKDIHGIFKQTDRSKLNKLAHMFLEEWLDIR